MLRFLIKRLQSGPPNACFCTLAVHEAYRRRARALVRDALSVPWIVLTDEPDAFAGLPVRAIRHEPMGPMAIDFLTRLPPMGNGRGRPAYHDKRFALQAALRDYDTAIFVDADTRIRSLPVVPRFQPGIAADKELRATIAEHLSRWGTHRLPVFEQLAVHLTGNGEMLNSARWCSEALFAVTKDGNEAKFFDAWARGAEFLQSKGEWSGEGGVIGLATVCAGWTVDYKQLTRLVAAMRHEGQGPKAD